MYSLKKTTLYSVFSFRCPRCHKSYLFPPGTLYKLREFDKMYPACLCCGQSFEPKPGYSYGYIFINYALTAGIFLFLLLSLYYIFQKMTLVMIILTIAILVLGFTPLIYRLSRSIWLHLFIRYSPEAGKSC